MSIASRDILSGDWAKLPTSPSWDFLIYHILSFRAPLQLPKLQKIRNFLVFPHANQLILFYIDHHIRLEPLFPMLSPRYLAIKMGGGEKTPTRHRSGSVGSPFSRVSESPHLGLCAAHLLLAENLAFEITAVADMSSKFAGATHREILTSDPRLVRCGVASIGSPTCKNTEGRKYLPEDLRKRDKLPFQEITPPVRLSQRSPLSSIMIQSMIRIASSPKLIPRRP